jgi:glycosyltransferase involved in cell wall biosynthesis
LGATPLVSVVTPLYNSARFVRSTLESLQGQTFDGWESILVDDGSTDDTASVVEPFLADERFRYVRQENRGIAAARNAAFGLARGEWICLLDHDDRWLPGKLETQLAQAGDCQIVFTDAFVVTGTGRRRYSEDVGRDRLESLARSQPSRDSAIPVFLDGNPIAAAAAMFRAELVRTVGPFDSAAVPSDDYDFWLRSLAAGAQVRFVDEPLVEYVVHEKNYSRDTARLWRSIVVALETNRAALSPWAAELEAALAKRRRLYLLALLQRHRWSQASRELVRIAQGPDGMSGVLRALPADEVADAARRRAQRVFASLRGSG